MGSYRNTFSVKRLWTILAVSMLAMFSVLLIFGQKIYQQAPPIPIRVVTDSNEVVFTGEQIQRGQNVWQATGGMQQGSVWGHGSYLAPDWSADWLRREAEALLAIHASQSTSASLANQQALAEITMRDELRLNSYDAVSGTITISQERANAVAEVTAHYKALFQGNSAVGLKLRQDYAFPLHSSLNDEDSQALSSFFFWTSWAAVTNRPGDDISYTSNWPHDPLVGNTPPASLFMWSFISIVLLLAGIGALVWYYVGQYDIWRTDMEPEDGFAKTDLLGSATVTPSMRSTAKYFWVVVALFSAQVLLGILTAHYQVEGQGLYGLPSSTICRMRSAVRGTPS